MKSFFDNKEEDFLNKVNLKNKKYSEVTIIGAGCVGAVIAEVLRKKGKQVLIIDNNKTESGTRASGGLIKPSRFTDLDKDEFQKVVNMLDMSFGLFEEKLVLRPSGNLIKVGTYGVLMDKVFEIEKVFGTANFVNTKSGTVYYTDKHANLIQVISDLVVVAAGYESILLLPELCEKIGLIVKRGFSFHLAGSVPEAFVKFWAPYKQITIHNFVYEHENCIWAGDGSALTLPSWYDGRIKESWERVCGEFDIPPTLIRTIRGLRCFTKNKKYKPLALLKEGKCYLAVGAGKMGFISAGYSAYKIVENEFN